MRISDWSSDVCSSDLREILYRLACSDQGARLWQIAHGESRLQQINRAIRRLQRDFEKPIAIAELAATAGMSVSALDQHFQTISSMSQLGRETSRERVCKYG